MTVQHDPTATIPGSARVRPGRAWLVIALLCLFMLINFADKVVVGLAGVDIMRDLGIDAAQFGIVQSSFFWLFACGSVVGGLLTGRVPARWLLAGVATIWVLSLLPLIWSASFGVLIATRMLLGFAEGPAAAMATATAHTWFPADKRALPSSIVTAGAGLGPLIAAPVLTAVISKYSWHAAFAVLAVAGSIWVLAWFVLGKEGWRVDRSARFHHQRRSGTAGATAAHRHDHRHPGALLCVLLQRFAQGQLDADVPAPGSGLRRRCGRPTQHAALCRHHRFPGACRSRVPLDDQARCEQ